ncbi:MAG TPA: vanadium-dependent haloperoxidase [Vicinamibacterales bacterium]|nr:vanadium-dependent haloperoxidase [Vicinamibacterales bacterium]
MPVTRIPGITLVLAMVATAAIEVRAKHPSAEVVLEWNQLLQNTLPAPGNPLSPRYYSMVHIAMFDAINAIERDFEPYRVRLRPSGGAPDSAAAQAAHDILVTLNPSAAATYDAALAAHFGKRPSGFARRGAEIGARVAAEILEWRQNDGWVVSQFPAYSEPPLPGRWQPTPPANAAAVFTHVLQAAPMAVLSPTQFLPSPPPSLTSARYADDVNEVKALGKSDSAVRSAEQTTIAQLWSGVGTTTGFFSVWNNMAADVVRARNLSLIEAARLFALMNVSIHDALQTTQGSKFVYGVWRPVTAVRAADTDLNAETDPDPTWLPLIATPPYPSYAGNLAAIGASAARALELVSGTTDMPVAITWKQSGGLPDVTRHFDGFWQAADEEAMARIYGGVHYRFDQDAGQQVGRSVAEFVIATVMTPRDRRND